MQKQVDRTDSSTEHDPCIYPVLQANPLRRPWLIQEPDLFRELRPAVSVERFARLIISGQRPAVSILAVASSPYGSVNRLCFSLIPGDNIDNQSLCYRAAPAVRTKIKRGFHA